MSVPLKRYQKEFTHSYTFGVFPTLELIRYRHRHVQMVLVSERGSRNEGVRKLEAECSKKRIPFEVNDRAIERIAPRENVYAMGVFEKYTAPLSPERDHLALVNPSDMGNLGTSLRTAAGFGITDLALVRPAADIFDPRTIRASMGALFQASFAYFDSFDNYEAEFKHALYPFMTGGTVSPREVECTHPCTLVFGNESAGLPDEFRLKGTVLTIPHSSNIDSLNLPTAVGIALYEATKGQFVSSE